MFNPSTASASSLAIAALPLTVSTSTLPYSQNMLPTLVLEGISLTFEIEIDEYTCLGHATRVGRV